MHESERNRLEKERKAFLLAAEDMIEAHAAAVALETTADPHLIHALNTALSVGYARAFTTSTLLRLDSSSFRPSEPDVAEVHDLLLNMRDRVYAHTDRDGGRSASISLRPEGGWTVEWERPNFPRTKLPAARKLLEVQRTTFTAEALFRTDQLDA